MSYHLSHVVHGSIWNSALADFDVVKKVITDLNSNAKLGSKALHLVIELCTKRIAGARQVKEHIEALSLLLSSQNGAVKCCVNPRRCHMRRQCVSLCKAVEVVGRQCCKLVKRRPGAGQVLHVGIKAGSFFSDYLQLLVDGALRLDTNFTEELT